MARYVVLEHDHPFRHWDLMLEVGGVLRTWRLLEPPEVGTTVPVEPSFDHRLKYLDYEGPISHNRGTVTRWDHGEFTRHIPKESDDCDSVNLVLNGQRYTANAVLERDRKGHWQFTLYPPPA